jgi:hypothetical protein
MRLIEIGNFRSLLKEHVKQTMSGSRRTILVRGATTDNGHRYGRGQFSLPSREIRHQLTTRTTVRIRKHDKNGSTGCAERIQRYYLAEEA